MTSRRDRFALAAVVFAIMLSQVLLYPGIDSLVAALGAETALDASMWFLAAEFAAFVAFAGVWGAASDAVGRRRPFVVLGAIGGAAGYGLLAVLGRVTTVTFGTILGVRVLQGAATIGALSLAMTMLMDLGGGHGRNMGAAGIAIGLGTAIGSPIGGQLYEVGPLVPLFAASGFLVVVAGLALFVEERAATPQRTTLWRAVQTVRSTPVLGVPYAFGFIDRLTAGFFALVGTLYFRTVFDLDPGATGAMLALFFAPFALFQYPFGVLSDRIGRTIPIVAGSAAYGLGIVGVGLAPGPRPAGAMLFVVGVLGALMAPATMALVTDMADATERGVAMAGFNVFGSLGFLAGILAGGTIAAERGFRDAFLAVGGIEVAIALVMIPFFVSWRRRSPADGDGADETGETGQTDESPS
ncbi:MAG: MFS transporter [Halanaeroarchaeum sp.]